MEITSGAALLALCREQNAPISALARRIEAENEGVTEAEVSARMRASMDIMRQSYTEPMDGPRRLAGGMIGGEGGLPPGTGADDEQEEHQGAGEARRQGHQAPDGEDPALALGGKSRFHLPPSFGPRLARAFRFRK